VHKEKQRGFVGVVVAAAVAGGSSSQILPLGTAAATTFAQEKNREEKLNSPPGLTFGFWLRKISEP
jgi:hypothetical protein